MIKYLYYWYLFDFFQCFQVRRENGIPEGVWQAKRESIANEIENLGDDYSQHRRAGVVNYLDTAYLSGRKMPDVTHARVVGRLLRKMMSNLNVNLRQPYTVRAYLIHKLALLYLIVSI